MPRGGARNRSGPSADPTSGRSDRRGLSFTALPAEGYDGEAPDFPLPRPTPRELEVWATLWTSPQAAAWVTQPWRWQQVGEMVRIQARAEAQDSMVGLFDKLRQMRADLGLTPAGLKENGWSIAEDEVRAKRDEDAPAPRKSSRDRLRVVGGDE